MSAAIVLIHGRGPKPRKETLLDCWKSFLPRQIRTLPVEMVWWADLFKYDPPVMPDEENTCDHTATADLPDLSAQAFNTAITPEEMEKMRREITGAAVSWDDIWRVKDRVLETFWRGFTGVSGNQFALDAQNFFADLPNLRTVSRQRLKDAVLAQKAAGHQVMVIAHSFGAIVAYELARDFGADQPPPVHTLVTMGGPLAWCYDVMSQAKPQPTPARYLGDKEFPRFGVKFWWNVFDPADLVATAKVLSAAPYLAPVYRSGGRPVIVDCPIPNTYTQPGDLGSPHDYRGYLQSAPVQRAIELFMRETA